MEVQLDEPINVLNIPQRVIAALTLRQRGMPTVGNLTALTEHQLAALPRVGPVAIDKTQKELSRCGLTLRNLYKE